MEVLNIVFSAMNLLATVVIGVVQVTWMISRMSFGTNQRRNTILTTKSKRPPHSSPNSSGRLLNN